jgi:hypothetical protein
VRARDCGLWAVFDLHVWQNTGKGGGFKAFATCTQSVCCVQSYFGVRDMMNVTSKMWICRQHHGVHHGMHALCQPRHSRS